MRSKAKWHLELCTSTNPNIYAESENTSFDGNNAFYVLSNEESQSMENTITIEECYQMLKNMKSSKTPGSDGFSSEFYLYFWKELKYTMVNSFEESLEN
jgi:hypothetical protein